MDCCVMISFATGKGSVRLIDCGENFRAGTLAFFPQGKSFLHRIFLALQPATLNRVTDERLLVWRKFHFHCVRVRESHSRSNSAANALVPPASSS